MQLLNIFIRLFIRFWVCSFPIRIINIHYIFMTLTKVFLREAINYCMSQFIDSIDSVCVSNILEVISRPMKVILI